MPQMLDYARAWARRGFRVFPLRDGTNEVFKGFDWTNEATTDEARLLEWWGKGQNHNIGVLTDDMIVVDVDMKDGKNGEKSFLDLGLPAATLTVKTPSGGFHRYYAGPSCQNSIGKLGDGLDIRSYHGYVVAPGSRTAKGEYTLVEDRPLAAAPSDFIAKLDAPKQRIEVGPLVELDREAALLRATTYLMQDAPAPKVGNRNGTLFTVACAVKDYGLSRAKTVELIELLWNSRLEVPLELGEIEKTVGSAYDNGLLPPGVDSPEHHFAGVDVASFDAPPPAAQVPTEGLRDLLRPREFRDAGSIPRRPWMVKRMLLRGYVTTLVAPGAAGKSSFQLTLAAHIACGKGFAGFELEHPGQPIKSIVINLEDDRDEMERRMLAICIAHGLDTRVVAKNVTLLPGAEYFFKVADGDRKVTIREGDLRLITAVCKEDGIGVIFVDPFIETHDKDMNDNSGVKGIMALYRTLAQSADVAIMIAHHTSKGAISRMRAGDVDVSMGAAAITNSSRIAYTMFNATEEDVANFHIDPKAAPFFVRLDDAKQNMAAKSSKPVWFRRASVDLPSGDSVGVLHAEDMRANVDAVKTQKATIIRDYLDNEGAVQITTYGASKVLRSADPIFAAEFAGLSDKSAGRKMEETFAVPFEFEDGYVLRFTTVKGSKAGEISSIIKLE